MHLKDRQVEQISFNPLYEGFRRVFTLLGQIISLMGYMWQDEISPRVKEMTCHLLKNGG